MWIIRFQKLESKDYNYISRRLLKAWFKARKLSPILFIKALIYNKLQKKSWRQISDILWVNHIVLFNFYKTYFVSPEVKEIFNHLAKNKVIIYFWDNRIIKKSDLEIDNNFLLETLRELENLL